ncbi:MAG: polyamine aminopropyltransferase [Candidatus Tectimicrobiota bacterium]|nr:MAG: polyamine aminopropyltransferase [Candidatus Tectomicrobia bacterium]
MAAAAEPIWWYEHDFFVGIRQGLQVRLLYTERSPYQKIEVYEHALLGRILVLDDILQTTQADEFVYHEMLAQVPLLGQREAPVSVLIIGGGDGGVLREVLRHAWVQRVVMVEIDERVVRVAAEYLGINGNYDDPRVELRFEDGSAYVRSAAARAQPFDAVIIDATDPILGPGEALFSRQFFADVRACLAPAGVMVRHLGNPAYQREIFRTGVRWVHEVFGSVQVYRAAIPTYLGGDMAFVLSTNDGHSCQEPRLALRGRYYNHAVHRAAFVLPTWWQEVMEEAQA